MHIDQSLLEKYNTHGPRYTSYPTALTFNTDFGASDYRHLVERSNQDTNAKPLSIYLHIPFCQSLCYYCGCHKIVTQNQDRLQNYVDLLIQEIRLQGKLFGKHREVKQLHFGGGTPTYLKLSHLCQLLDALAENFILAPKASREQAIEIDPRTTTTGDIVALATMGFNRMSFGIQDFDPQVQTAINRIQDKAQTLALLDTARSAGVESVSVDLIYGLPKQSLEGFQKTLNAIAQARPDRISLYHYAHMPDRIKAQRMITSDSLPSSHEKLGLLKQGIETLSSAGYQYIGMDHFALPEDSLSRHLKNGTLHRNFQGYSTHSHCDLIGLGVSAISAIDKSFSQNYKSIKEYSHHIKQQALAIEKGYTTNEDDQIRAQLIQQIMCRQQLDIADFNQAQAIDFRHYFEDELKQLEPMIKDGLVKINDKTLTITARGLFFRRNLAMVFDSYLSKPQHDHRQQKQQKVVPLQFSKVL